MTASIARKVTRREPKAAARGPRVCARGRAVKSTYHHGNLREALIDAGLELLARQGAVQLSLRSVARKIGVSQMAPYHHFEDKNALLAALATEGFRKLASNVEASPLHKHPLERRISGLCAGLVRFAQENPELFRIMYDGHIRDTGSYPDLVKAASHSYLSLVQRVRETLVQFEIKNVDVDYVSMAIFALGYGMAKFVLQGRISPEANRIIGDGSTFVREVSAILAAGFARPSRS